MGSPLWFHELNLLLWLLLLLYSIWKKKKKEKNLVLSELIMTWCMNLFFNPQWRLRHCEGNTFVCACIRVWERVTTWVCAGWRGWRGYWIPLPLSFTSLIIILQTEASILKSEVLLWQKEGKSGLALRASSRETICYLIFIGLFWWWMEWEDKEIELEVLQLVCSSSLVRVRVRGWLMGWPAGWMYGQLGSATLLLTTAHCTLCGLIHFSPDCTSEIVHTRKIMIFWVIHCKPNEASCWSCCKDLYHRTNKPLVQFQWGTFVAHDIPSQSFLSVPTCQLSNEGINAK